MAYFVERASGQQESAGALDGSFQAVSLRRGEEAGPIVVMVPSWDDVFGYQSLADALPADVTVVALACRADAGIETVADFVGGAIGRVVEAIEGRESVTVLGWSVGGVVAVELAAALVASGQHVDRVALVDTLFPGEGDHLWSNRWWKYKSLLTPQGAGEIARELRIMVRRRTSRASVMLRRRMASRPGDDPSAGSTPSAASGAFPVESLGHRLDPIKLPVVFYAASATNPDRTLRRWPEVAEHFEVVHIRGRHRGFDSIMRSPRVAAVASDLSCRLR